MNKRMPKDKLVIGAYFLKPYAQTEEHVSDMAECGVNMIVCFAPMDRAILDTIHKYGIGCIMSGVMPGWWGGDGSNAGTMGDKYPPRVYHDCADKFEDHPAIWGLDLCDEPSALDFEHLSRAARLVEKIFPNQFAYLNLYPNYAAVAKNNESETKCQLGTATYEEYIARYAERVDLPYISYDFYLYPQTKNHNVGKMLDNFRIASDACRRTGKDFWYIPMVNGRYETDFTSENMLRYQAYIALCYGATVINWACYTAGWWFNQVLDENGNKTEQYEKLKKINAELHSIGDEFMKYRSVATHLVGYGDEEWKADFPEVMSKDSLDTGFVRGLRADKAKLVVGQMVHKEDSGRAALFVCNASDPFDTDNSVSTVRFSSHGRSVTLHSGEGSPILMRDGDEYRFELKSSHGAMITFE